MASMHSKLDKATTLKGMVRYLYCSVPSHCNSNVFPVDSVETESGEGLGKKGIKESGKEGVEDENEELTFPVPPWIAMKVISLDSIAVPDSLVPKSMMPESTIVKMELGEGSRSPMQTGEGGSSSRDDTIILDPVEGKQILKAAKKRRRSYKLNKHFQEN